MSLAREPEMLRQEVLARPGGIIAAGHDQTVAAAAALLREGGNAFDAALAALLAACVAEPVLASLGGGGFLLAHNERLGTRLYDFFAQTPCIRRPAVEVDFHPIVADFGVAQQEFHIGMGAMATPGVVRGLFAIHRDLCRLPLAEIAAPALRIARQGVTVNAFQAYIAEVVGPILRSSPGALAVHQSPAVPGRVAVQGEVLCHAQFADALDALIRYGEDLFYTGEMGQRLVTDCRAAGGHLTDRDLRDYRVQVREPLRFTYRGARLATNPAPSIGGMLIAFSLALLESVPLPELGFGSESHLRSLARAMALTQRLRREQAFDGIPDQRDSQRLLSEPLLGEYRRALHEHHVFERGTTQISVIDAAGNLASMTLSNGEGCGYVIPGTGIMMNNMLGEEDINPRGFHRWPTNRRIASMMAPTLMFADDGRALATGSGGSNRIRSSILQVLSSLIDFDSNLDEAVARPRIHFESGQLNLEPGFESSVLDVLRGEFADQRRWEERNLFFGGAHAVMRDGRGRLFGAGDPRRGGVCRAVGID